MSVHANRWKLGFFVVLGVGLTMFTLIWLGASAFDRVNLPVITFFSESVQGLDVGSAAKYKGVKIGEVTQIGVAEDQSHVEVHMNLFLDVMINMGFKIEAEKDIERCIERREWSDGRKTFLKPDRQDLRIQLASAGITGMKFAQFTQVDVALHPPPKLPFDPPWNYIPSMTSTLQSLEEGITEAMRALPQLMTKLSALTTSIEKTVEGLEIDKAQERVFAVLDNANQTLEELKAAIQGVRDPDGPVERLVARVDAAIADAQATLDRADVGATAAAFRDTADATTLVLRDATDMNGEIQSTLIALRRTLESIEELARLLEHNPEALLAGKRPPAQEFEK